MNLFYSIVVMTIMIWLACGYFTSKPFFRFDSMNDHKSVIFFFEKAAIYSMHTIGQVTDGVGVDRLEN